MVLRYCGQFLNPSSSCVSSFGVTVLWALSKPSTSCLLLCSVVAVLWTVIGVCYGVVL